jgi:RHH-type proline utilization regulon transcriptional repressor/proline dehydrogenase/delta 1-pyrroline-5-carboxylate dehydrogenase
MSYGVISDFYPTKDKFLSAIEEHHRKSDEEMANIILPLAKMSEAQNYKITQFARKLVKKTRELRLQESGLDAFMFQYDLSSEEGVALMCLAEALLRVPDKSTMDKLIRDKIALGDWQSHSGKSKSLFVNAATWALMLTGKVINKPKKSFYKQQEYSLTSAIQKLAAAGGEPVVRQAISQAMKILGKQFVMGRNIKEAIKRAKDKEKLGYTYSYDMLGEAAFTQADADKYFNEYLNAIKELKNDPQSSIISGAGISIKLSALHPRFEALKIERLKKELLPKVIELVLAAIDSNISLTIDAEESFRLMISLEIFEDVLKSGVAKDYEGLGLAVQAYQKRSLFVLDWLYEKTKQYNQNICVRLVKGAYWDTEIKHAQVMGLSDYPVFTRKDATDVNYIACSKKLLSFSDTIYSQFATHNAQTLSTIKLIAEELNVSNYEFQCLHGMGDALYNDLVKNHKTKCRIYAPVGTHEDLLAYLVRRLLENGANSSFVNRISDERQPIDDIIADPVEKYQNYSSKKHSKIPLPKQLYGDSRKNSIGLDFSNPYEWEPLLNNISKIDTQYQVKPTNSNNDTALKKYQVNSPINGQLLGSVTVADKQTILQSINIAENAFKLWRYSPALERARMLEKSALLLEQRREELIRLLIEEAGKTLEDAINELREAVDFCYYYALQVKKSFVEPDILVGPTGEHNQISYHARGVITCISPWNFPLAIFLGQVAAGLAAGNCVIAKPASQTVLIAHAALNCLYDAGFDKDVVQLLPCSGKDLGETLIPDDRIKAVLFTGSTDTAKGINITLAKRNGAIIPFIAETGGQNAMIVDSSALPEQVTADVIMSAFKSAGQRCSALRVLYLQDDVADKMLRFITGALNELKVGDPRNLSTDIGPVIDNSSRQVLDQHVTDISKQAKVIASLKLDEVCKKGSFISPIIIEIQSISELKEEVFGPVLHVIRYRNDQLDNVIQQINSTGFGLTLGIHSRVNETVNYIQDRVNVGNIYVNRNMIGAVVGVQPFGGEGLSGTGPKAGGPNYVQRLATERTLSINSTASGGNATLMSLQEDS